MIPLPLLVGETLRAVSPVRLVLTDTFTGEPPIGRLNPLLEQLAADGVTWSPVPVRPRVTSSGVLVYPNLGLTVNVSPGATLKFRLTLDPDYYRPFYRHHRDHLEFDVRRFNHREPHPLPLPALPDPAEDYRFLVPGPLYPFPAHVTVLYGQVVKDVASTVGGVLVSGGNPLPKKEVVPEAVRDLAVQFGLKAFTLTDEDGAFALPLSTPAGKITLDLRDDHVTPSKSIQADVDWANRTKYLTEPLKF